MKWLPVTAVGYQYRRVSAQSPAQFRCSSALLAAAAAFIDPTSGREPRPEPITAARHPHQAAAAGHAAHTAGGTSILRRYIQSLGLLSPNDLW